MTKMKKLFLRYIMKLSIILLFVNLSLLTSLQSQSYKFIAVDDYYNTPLPIDSILVYNMNTKEELLFKSDSVFLATKTNVEDFNWVKGYSLYPNPTTGVLNFSLSDRTNAHVIITDMTGKLLFVGDFNQNSEVTLDVSGLPAGVYNLRFGDNSRTFIKLGESSGNDISVLNTFDKSKNYLVKENKIQSQFDYRFTIYSKGFNHYNYYSKAITNDTTITIKMSPIPSGISQKHIRVELYLSNIRERVDILQHNWPEIIDTTVTNYKTIMFDTLVIRNYNLNTVKNYKIENDEDDDFDVFFDRHKLKFDINIDNLTLNNFSFLYEYNKYETTEYGSRFENNERKTGIELNNDSIKLDSNLSAIVYLSEIKYQFKYHRYEYYSYNCPGHYRYYNLLSYDPKNSYIKIEFLD